MRDDLLHETVFETIDQIIFRFFEKGGVTSCLKSSVICAVFVIAKGRAEAA